MDGPLSMGLEEQEKTKSYSFMRSLPRKAEFHNGPTWQGGQLAPRALEQQRSTTPFYQQP